MIRRWSTLRLPPCPLHRKSTIRRGWQRRPPSTDSDAASSLPSAGRRQRSNNGRSVQRWTLPIGRRKVRERAPAINHPNVCRPLLPLSALCTPPGTDNGPSPYYELCGLLPPPLAKPAGAQQALRKSESREKVARAVSGPVHQGWLDLKRNSDHCYGNAGLASEKKWLSSTAQCLTHGEPERGKNVFWNEPLKLQCARSKGLKAVLAVPFSRRRVQLTLIDPLTWLRNFPLI